MERAVILSGMHSGTNPSPGLGIARSLRMAKVPHRLIGLDYSPDSSGLHSSILDDRVLMPTWDEIEIDTWARQLEELVSPFNEFVSSLDLEVRLIAKLVHDPGRFLSPDNAALVQVLKPPRAVADALGLRTAASLHYDDEEEMADFIRGSRSGVWVKGQHYEATRAFSLSEAVRAGQRIVDLWGGRWHAEHHVAGQEAGIAFVARQGVLLDCVHMRKTVLTATGKTWAGEVSDVECEMRERLQSWVQLTGWNGGGELELIEGWDQTLTLMEVNPRLPAWIHGATLALRNLPAALIYGHRESGRATSSGSFTRVVEEILTDDALGAPPFPWSPDLHVSAASKHPSGMPAIARRGLVAESSDPAGDSISDVIAHGREVTTPTSPTVTPYLQIDSSTLQSQMDQVRNSIDHDDVTFAYSVKTNPDPSLIRAALRSCMSVEAISQDELALARDCGAHSGQLILNGPAKWWPRPLRPVETRAIFIDSVPEFEVIHRLLDGGLQIQTDVFGLRLSRRRMGSRFGVQVDKASDLVLAAHGLRDLVSALGCEWGVHFHTAQSTVGVAQWVDDCVASLRGAVVLADELGSAPSLIDLGGGWHPRDLRHLPEAVANVRASLSDEFDWSVPWIFELGKSVLEPCGTLFTRVIVPQNSAGDVVVDAGLSDLPEGPYWPHPAFVLDGGERKRLKPGGGRILGRTCMERDVLAQGLELGRLRVGDIIAFDNAGGYDASMAYPFGRGLRHSGGAS